MTLILSGLLGLAAACSSAGPTEPKLSRDETQLVDLYVQLTLLERAHSSRPDSAETAFQALSRSYDSTAVRRALARLEADPLRWQGVYEAITGRLNELQHGHRPGSQTPADSTSAPSASPRERHP